MLMLTNERAPGDRDWTIGAQVGPRPSALSGALEQMVVKSTNN